MCSPALRSPAFLNQTQWSHHLKHFTPAWHSGELDDAAAEAVSRAYQRHLASLLPHLPPHVQALAAINLHDGLLQRVVADAEQASLLLTLRCGDLQVGYFDLDLHYLQVPSLPSLGADFAGLVLSREALYDEVDTEADGFVHRILFTSGNACHERIVRFKQLRLRATPRESRHDTSGHT